MTGPVIAVLLVIAILVARAYPLSLKRQVRIRALLLNRQDASRIAPSQWGEG